MARILPLFSRLPKLAALRPSSRRGHRSTRSLAAAIEALESRRLMTTITGLVYADTNGNGTRDSGEAVLPGVEVTYDGANNTASINTGYTVSGAASSGTHYVGIDTPAGWTLTQPSGGTYVNTGSTASYNFGIQFAPGFTASAPSASEVVLTWSNGDSALRTVIERSSNGGTTWTDLTPTPLSGVTSYTDTDTALTAGTTYEYSLTLVGTSGHAVASATQSVETLSSTLTTVHDTTLTISTSTLGAMGAIPWSEWSSASLVTGTTAAGGTVTANEDGTWTYTPPTHWVGSDTLTYTLSNGTTTSAPLPLTVQVTDQAPQAGSIWEYTSNSEPTVSTHAAPAVTGTLEATDGDGDSVTFHLVNPDGTPATVDDDGNVATSHGEVSLDTDGYYTYSPAPGFVGVDRFFFVANDGVENSAVASVTVSVETGTPVLTVPDMTDPDGVGVAWTFSIGGSIGSDIDTSQFEVLSSPSHGTLTVNSDGTLTYTASSTGLDSFAFSCGSDVPSSTILIDDNTGWDPTWTGVGGASYTVSHGDTLTQAAAGGVLTGVEYAPGGTPTATLLSGPASGTLSLSSNGSFTYEPADNSIGWVYFTYEVNAGGATSPPATAAILVTDSLSAESHSPLDVSTTPGTAVSLDPRTNFVDAAHPLDTLTTIISSGLGPHHGTLTTNDDGTLTYTPTTGFRGIDSFTYQVSDGVTDATFGSISQTDSLDSGYCTVYITVSA